MLQHLCFGLKKLVWQCENHLIYWIQLHEDDKNSILLVENFNYYTLYSFVHVSPAAFDFVDYS